MSIHNNNKRIAKNTLILYFRMILMMVISLYTSRIVLNTLGVDNYGIYNVVGGVVSMFSLLSGSLSASISRFLTFEIGKGDINRIKNVFSTSINIQVILSIIIVVLAEICGVWFLNNKMVIPEERLNAANWVLQCSIVTFAINLISIPYNAIIVAYEHMKAFAYVSIIEVILKLVIVYILLITKVDKLILYAILLLCVSVIIRFIYGIYCKKHFKESNYKFIFDKVLMRNMIGFAGWNFFGSGSQLLMTQGVNMLMNLFFGVTVNAARGIAVQVEGAVMSFVTNFTTALNPQITKSYASENKDYMFSLMCVGAKYSYFLLLILSLPIIFQTETILIIWLNQVPKFACAFIRMTLIISLVSVLSNTMITAMLATGKIKRYQLIVGGTGMLVFPLAWLLYEFGYPPIYSYLIHLIIFIIQLAYRIFLLQNMIGFPITMYLNNVLFKVTKVTIVTIIIPLLLYMFVPIELYWYRFFSIVLSCILCSICSIYLLGINKDEKELLLRKLSEIKCKFIK